MASESSDKKRNEMKRKEQKRKEKKKRRKKRTEKNRKENACSDCTGSLLRRQPGACEFSP